MSVQAMFHGGPLDGQRIMLPEAVPVFRAPVSRRIYVESETLPPLPPAEAIYKRERLSGDMLEQAEAHKFAIRYFVVFEPGDE